MTNLEKYFGIKVRFKQILEAFKLSYLRKKALNLMALEKFDMENFFVYVHTLTIHVNHKHFSGSLSLEERIKELEVKFCVNQKQAKTGQIRFYNDVAKIDLPKGITEAYGDTELIRYFPGTILMENESLETEIITFIDKSLVKESYKKIKVHISAVPTKNYRSILSKSGRDEFITSIDLKLTKDVQLEIPFSTNKTRVSENEFLSTLTELETLYQALDSENNEINSEDLELIKNAVIASENKDDKTLKNLLKNVGEGTFKVAKDIGLPIVLELMK